jgi:indolepyruvate ferredoxin oxidoreductase beta subunit
MKDDNNVNKSKGSTSFVADMTYIEKYRKLLEEGYTVSVLFTGVGGQGIILITTVLAEAAHMEGMDVKVSEVHGMAQRGGSVIGSVRLGKKVFSPIVDKADFIISLEKLEALRYIERLKQDGFILINDFEVYPVSIYLGDQQYPKDIISKIAGVTSKYLLVEAVDIARRLGEIRASNMVLLGCLSGLLPLSAGAWMQSIKENVPRKSVDVNLEAFSEGRRIIQP